MASLHVRQLEPELIEALKERARKNHRSAEAEHRLILRDALLSSPPPSSLAQLLLQLPSDPSGAHDDAFRRVQDDEATDVFG